MDDLNVSNHLAIASEAFLQVVMLLGRILTISAGVAFAITVVGIIWLCLNEGRERLPERIGAGRPVRASRKVIQLPVTLSAEPRHERVALSAQHRRA